jgi:hypothetical protein
MYMNVIEHDRLSSAKAMLELKKAASEASRKARLAKAVSTVGTDPLARDNDITVFMPEDLQKFWTAETVRNTDIVMSRKLAVVPAYSTVHKWVTVEEYGGRYTTHFFAEDGSLPAVNKTKARDGEVTLKLFGERRQIGNLVEVVGQIGNINPAGPPMISRSGRARETANAIRAEVIAYEHNTLWGDSAVDPLEFDGIVKQIKQKGVVGLNVHDLRGAPLTFGRLLKDIMRLRSKPYSARIEEILLTSTQWASLAVEASDSARWMRSGAEGIKIGDGWTFNPVSMHLISPFGDKTVFTIVQALAPEIALPTVAEGSPPNTLSYSDVTSITAGGSGSQFAASDAGVYKYAIKAVFRTGSPVHFVTPNITVNAGQSVTCVMADSSFPVVWYDIWRTDKTGNLSTLAPLFRTPAKNVSGHTEWTDSNALLPGKETVLACQFSEHAMFRAELLPPVSFPIPYAGFAKDFIIARCDAPAVNHYNRQLCYYNVGSNTI